MPSDVPRQSPVHEGVATHISAAEGSEVPAATPNPPLDPNLAVEASLPPVGHLIGANSSPVLTPTVSNTNRHSPSCSRVFVSSPASPLVGSDLEDDDVNMFLNLDNDDDAQFSSESTKKRRLDEGDASSPSYPVN